MEKRVLLESAVFGPVLKLRLALKTSVHMAAMMEHSEILTKSATGTRLKRHTRSSYAFFERIIKDLFERHAHTHRRPSRELVNRDMAKLPPTKTTGKVTPPPLVAVALYKAR